MALKQKVAGRNALSRLVTKIKQLYLPLSGGTVTGPINFNKAGNSIGTIGDYLSIASDGNEICLSGAADGEIWVNYRKNHLGHAPTTYSWGDGSRGGYASHNIKNLTAKGSVTAVSVNQTSDRRKKKSICDISDNDVCKINGVRFVKYRFKGEKSNRKRYGVIAQELENAGLGNLVTEDDDGIKAVDYISMLCLKVEELTARIEALENGTPMPVMKAKRKGIAQLMLRIAQAVGFI